MTNLAMWSMIVGFFLPLLLAVVQQPRWPSYVRSIVMFLGCLVASAGTVILQGEFSGERWVESALLIIVTTIATYKGLWKPIEVAPAIEDATSPGTTPNP